MLILPMHEYIYISTYFCCLQFLSSVSYNFPSTGLLLPGFNLFLGILIFYIIVNVIDFLVSFSDSSLLVYKIQTISKYLFCILLLY